MLHINPNQFHIPCLPYTPPDIVFLQLEEIKQFRLAACYFFQRAKGFIFDAVHCKSGT